MAVSNKSIKIWADEKVVLADALHDVIENVYGRGDAMSKIYEHLEEKLNRTLMTRCNDSSFCYLDIFGGEEDACLFALSRSEHDLAGEIASKIKCVPNKSPKYY